eukprot:Sspe_Gene.76225::Locus_47632_Transcript_1_1_Confidence_1.000_Length_746::g.76225::m.76225
MEWSLTAEEAAKEAHTLAQQLQENLVSILTACASPPGDDVVGKTCSSLQIMDWGAKMIHVSQQVERLVEEMQYRQLYHDIPRLVSLRSRLLREGDQKAFPSHPSDDLMSLLLAREEPSGVANGVPSAGDEVAPVEPVWHEGCKEASGKLCAFLSLCGKVVEGDVGAARQAADTLRELHAALVREAQRLPPVEHRFRCDKYTNTIELVETAREMRRAAVECLAGGGSQC